MRSRTPASGYTHKGTIRKCKMGVTTAGSIDVSPTIAKIGKQRMFLREVGASDRQGSPNSLTEI